jgi:nucleoside-diphosphate-sugar epimerase
MNKNILISGASGFVGQNLITYLNHSGFNPLAITRQQLHGKIDLTGAYAVVHLAGKAHDLKHSSNPEEYYQVNFELTKKLYDEFVNSSASIFIFMSSVKASADHVFKVLKEDHQPDPVTAYGQSKLMAEQYIQNQKLPTGKSYIILRPCMIHGPGNKGNLNLLYQFVKKGFAYPLAAYQNKRSFLSVENLCFVIAQLLEKQLNSGVYHIADDEALATNEVVSIIAETIGRKPKLLAIPHSFIVVMAKIGSLLKLPFNEERLYKLTENYVVSNQKIKNAIGVKLPLSAKEGLVNTIKSFSH